MATAVPRAACGRGRRTKLHVAELATMGLRRYIGRYIVVRTTIYRRTAMWGPFFLDLDSTGSCAGRRSRWGWDNFGDRGPSRGRGHWRGRAGRLFEQGDLKYVILRLLEEKPRHGYDII